MGTTCCKSIEESDTSGENLFWTEDHEGYESTVTCGLPGDVQISVQCKENPEGQDGFIIYDKEAFPINFLFLSGAKGLAKNAE